MVENTIKSNQRVKDHGEVFTPVSVVQFMLNQPGIKEITESLDATFLEPSAGEGAFLLALLERKLEVAARLSESASEYDENALIGLSSLYGVELLEDNIEQLVMNLIILFSNVYSNTVTEKFDGTVNGDVIESAKTIIRANMLQGNALTGLTDRGDELIFSEWKILPMRYRVRKVQRTEYTLDSILNDGNPMAGISNHDEVKEFDLFTGWLEDDDSKKAQPELLRYKPVKITEVYQRLTETEDAENEDD